MPFFFNRGNKQAQDVFPSKAGTDIRDKQLDLPSKLTILLKRGMGKRYYVDPKKLDAPIKQQHKQYLKDQFLKATYDKYIRSISLEIDRRKSFEDYTTMNYTPEISSALDIYADECLTKNEYGEVVHIECENPRIKEVLENLFNDVLGVEHNLWGWTRNTCQYGNHFLLLDIQPGNGVVGFLPLPVGEIRREEAYDGKIGSVKFIWDTNNTIFDNWQVAHFRLLSDIKKEPYGTSSLEAGRVIWKQLQLAEDAMLIYRITRAPERRIFYIDVGNIKPDDVADFIKKIKDEVKRTPTVDATTGNIDFKYNPMAVDEDFFIPRRGDKNTEIETLPGACLSLDTKIPLLDGTIEPLEKVINRFNNGEKMWVYSINQQTKEICPAPISWAGVTRKNTEVLRITLDNGESIICTPDHKFPTWSRGMCGASDLCVNDSLVSFNKKTNIMYEDRDYEQVYNHGSNSWVYTHRLVNDHVCLEELQLSDGIREERKIIHHVDLNRFNNCPENLRIMGSKDHFVLHSRLGKIAVNRLWDKFYGDSKYREKFRKNMSVASKKAHANMDPKVKEKMYRDISKSVSLTMGNYSEDEHNNLVKKCTKAGKMAMAALNKRLNLDSDFKKEITKKRSDGIKKTFSTKEYKGILSKSSKKKWEDDDYRNKCLKNQNTVFSTKLLNLFVDFYKDSGFNFYAAIEKANNDNVFMGEFYRLNSNVRSSLFDPNKFSLTNAEKMIRHFNYSGRREFKENVKEFNHKIAKIEWLDERIDTGTITVDGGHTITDNHTFALACGVFTKNSNLDEISDIEYLQQKMYSSLKIPKAYFSDESDINSKATLAGQDFRFARTINRMQQAILGTLTQIAILHLFSLGFREKEQLTGFELELTNPSTISELEKLEMWEKKASIFKAMWDSQELSPISFVWGSKEIMGFNDDQTKAIIKQQYLEGKIAAKFAEVASPQPPMAEGGEEEAPEEGAEQEFVDDSGESLPPEPPEGKAYVDAETGEVIESLDKRLSRFLFEHNKAFGKKKNAINNKALVNNTFLFANMEDIIKEMEDKYEVLLDVRQLNEEVSDKS